MRLILLVRKMQRSQLAILHRFDEVRSLTAAVSAVRGGFTDLDERLERASAAFERMERGLEEGFEKLEPPEVAAEKVEVFDEGVARLEALAQHLGELVSDASEPPPHAEEMGAALANLQTMTAVFEGLAERFETASVPQVPVPQVPVGAEASAPAAGRTPPGEPLDESESGRLRDALRASELARAELEALHAQQLTQMADHARDHSKRLEEDIKKKKRGMAELTQQNIALQIEARKLQEKVEALSTPPQRLTPVLPAELGARPGLAALFDPGVDGAAYAAPRGSADEDAEDDGGAPAESRQGRMQDDES